MAERNDAFANLANVEVTESAANTLTFQKLDSGAGIFEKMAMIIHRVEYAPAVSTIQLLVAAGDLFNFAWTTSNQITGLAKDKAQVIDNLVLGADINGGAPQNMNIMNLPIVHDFANLPGGGLIVPVTNLYCAIMGASVASPGYLRSSLFFTYRSLKAEEYWELVEATRALS